MKKTLLFLLTLFLSLAGYAQTTLTSPWSYEVAASKGTTETAILKLNQKTPVDVTIENVSWNFAMNSDATTNFTPSYTGAGKTKNQNIAFGTTKLVKKVESVVIKTDGFKGKR